jgi:hypothetical protein
MDVLALVTELAACDPSVADRDELVARAKASGRIRAWLDAFDIEVGRALDTRTGYGQKVLADATNISMHAAEKVLERGRTLRELPRLEAAVKAGDVSGAHVDAATRALRQVPAARREVLARKVDSLVHVAASVPAHEFEEHLKMEARKLLDDDGLSRLQQQKRSIRLRTWVDRVFGMWRAALSLDPQTAVWVDKRIQDEVDRLFADGVPDDAPEDPIERQQYLAALAVLSLLAGEGARTGRPEVIAVYDATALDENGEPTIDCGLPVDIPRDAWRDLLARAKTHVVAIWPPADLDLGRSQRLASAAQRRVLRALYPTCAVPDCPVRFPRCKVHHVWWWEHGGPTDLENLLPVCARHHSCVHDKGWKLKLLPDRTLEITVSDGTTMTTGPPSRAP